MRRIPITIVVALVASLVTLAAIASAGQGGSGLDEQDWKWRTKKASTSSTAWRRVPGLRNLAVCVADGLSATVSAELRGAPVEVRVHRDGLPTGLLRPGKVRFQPFGGSNTFSFTFVGGAQNGIQLIDVEWRSPTGNPVTLSKGVLNVQFEGGVCG